MVSQPRSDKLFKKREKKIAKNKTATAGDISFDKWQTLLPVIGEAILNLVDCPFQMDGSFPTSLFRGDLFVRRGGNRDQPYSRRRSKLFVYPGVRNLRTSI